MEQRAGDLADWAVELHWITPEQLRSARAFQVRHASTKPLEDLLVSLGFLTLHQLARLAEERRRALEKV